MAPFVAIVAAGVLALAAPAAAEVDCSAATTQQACGDLGDECSYDKGYRRHGRWIRKPSCHADSCDDAPGLFACNGISSQVCKYSGGVCTEVTECSDANGAVMCDRLTGCSYDKGYKRFRKWVRKPSCFDTPANCAAATTAFACDAVSSEVCKFSDGTCAEVTECSEATSEGMCGRLTDCSYDKGYKRFRKWVRKPSCFDTPANCAAATTAIACNAVSSEVCKFSDGTCAEVTECSDATGATMCNRLTGCSYDQGWKRRGRWIRKPSCITTPLECANTKIAPICAIVDANCAMVGGACTEITSCGQAPNKKTCDGVGTCGGWVPGKWVKFGRRKKFVKSKCTPGPTSAPTTAAPTTAAPTDAPTLTPFTDTQCMAFDGDKAGCQGKADRGCVWNAAQISGPPSAKYCTDGREDHFTNNPTPHDF